MWMLEIMKRPCIPSYAVPQSPCECCGGSEYFFASTKRGWKLWECRKCGVFFVWPQPTFQQLASIYSQSAGYFATSEQELSKTSPYDALQLNQHFQSLGMSNGRLLDVGCALGSFMYHMQGLGWEVEGIDINGDAVKVARKNHLTAHIGEFQTYSFPASSFDVICMRDVIEHGRSPKQMLLTAGRLLRPGGLLLVKTPNGKASFATATLKMAKILKFPWPHSEAPYHLYEFTPKSLNLLVTSAGFDVINFSLSGRVHFFYKVGASGFFDKLKVEIKHNRQCKTLWKLLMCFPKLISVSGLFLPYYIYALLMDRFKGIGNNMFLIARFKH
jgi:2-polyprenyl-3-methyl-5-hydroxy-6-metoxy-1,4-benzoquinol methylase